MKGLRVRAPGPAYQGRDVSPQLLYGFIVLAALAHATWNSLVKGAEDRLLMMSSIRVVGLVFGFSLLPFVPWPTSSAWIWLFAAVAAHYAYYFLLIRSYGVGDMSLVYPIARGAAPLLLALMAFFAVGERLTILQFAAVMLTSAGLMALVSGRRDHRAAIGLAFATSISISAYSFFGGIGVRSSSSVLGFQAWLEILTGIGVIGFAILRRSAVLAFACESAPIGLLAGVLSVAGYLAFLAAAHVLPLGPVAAIRESSLVFGAVIGALVFKEEFGARRAIASSLVASGMIALALT